MTELVQLERRHEDFAKRNARLVVASIESPADARATKKDFPHLTVLADERRTLSDAAALVHKGAHPGGGDADAPTTILIDSGGVVRWIYRSPLVVARLSPDDLIRAIDEYIK